LKGGNYAVDILRVTVIGKDLCKIVEGYMELAGINTVNTVNTVRTGMLGNLTTHTYEVVMREDEVIKKRGIFMEKMAEDSMRLMPMYVHGDWMRIFVMKPIRT
jgi:hypothetical protein